MKLQTIMDEIAPLVSQNTLGSTGVKAFIGKYSGIDTDDVEWVDICRDAETYGCYKYSFLLMVRLLQKRAYHGRYADKLYRNLPKYERMRHQRSMRLVDAMCGSQIDQQVIYINEKPNSQQWFSFSYINTTNPFIIDVFESHLNSMVAHGRWCPREVAYVFGKSLGIYEDDVHTVADFTATTMFEQADFYKTYFKGNEDMRRAGLKFVVNFYRWLVRNHPDYSYFENEFHMSEKLLFNNRLSELLERDFYFTTLNPTNIPYGKKRVCFIMKGFENETTRITNDDYVTIDFSGLTDRFYRDLLIEFIVTSPSISAIQWVGIPAYIREAMEKVYQAKQVPSYPNKRLDYLTNQEAVFIRQIFDAQDIGIRTKNNKIGAVRRFVSYCVDKKAIKVDDLFFDYLIQYEEPNKNTAKTIPDKALVRLSKALSEKGKNNLLFKEMYVIFHLAIQTEFRINQICHLQVDCIRPTIKPNQFEVFTNSKTSHGRKKSYVISTMTYNLLMDIIEETEPIRIACPVDSMYQYIFIYNQSAVNNRPVVFNDRIFAFNLTKTCEELDIERYTASNLRDTHMTKALEHIMRNGKSDLEMSVLSKHKYMDTTKNHYIETELEKMLESTYGITIGTELIQADSKVVDEVPEHLQGEENDVENGCGKCTAERCVMTSSLPCMVCKHFITTAKHEVYFKKAIENIDRLIKATPNRHDKEDLVTIKELHVLYLKAIIKHKEGLKNDD